MPVQIYPENPNASPDFSRKVQKPVQIYPEKSKNGWESYRKLPGDFPSPVVDERAVSDAVEPIKPSVEEPPLRRFALHQPLIVQLAASLEAREESFGVLSVQGGEGVLAHDAVGFHTQ